MRFFHFPLGFVCAAYLHPTTDTPDLYPIHSQLTPCFHLIATLGFNSLSNSLGPQPAPTRSRVQLSGSPNPYEGFGMPLLSR